MAIGVEECDWHQITWQNGADCSDESIDGSCRLPCPSDPQRRYTLKAVTGRAKLAARVAALRQRENLARAECVVVRTRVFSRHRDRPRQFQDSRRDCNPHSTGQA